MSLRDKTLLIILLTLFVLIGVLYFAVRVLILNEVHRFEAADQLEEVDAVRNVWMSLVDSLGVTTRDWAYWDDTWSFMETRDPAYVLGNLEAQSLSNIDVDFIVHMDAEGGIVHARGLDRSSLQTAEIPAAALADLRRSRALWRFAADDETAGGLLFMDGRPAIVSSAAILSSARNGPRRGVLVMGRYVTAKMFRSLGGMVRRPVRALWLGSGDLEGEPPETVAFSQDGNRDVLVVPVRDPLALGYVLVRDINAQPALLLKVRIARSAHMAALMGLHTLLSAVLAVALALALVMLMLLQRFVLKPVGALGAWARGIGPRGAVSDDARGVDEVQTLDRQIRALVSAVRQSEARFRELAEMLPETIFETDMAGRFTFVNRATEAAWGYSQEEAMSGMTLFDVIAPADAHRVKENMRKRFLGERGSNEYTGVRKDGSQFPVAIYSTVRYLDGKPAGLRGLVINLTDRKRFEQVSVAKEAAERSSRLKSEFLANMSHELRTPLNTIIGFSEALRDGVYGFVNDRQARAVEDIRSSGRHLLKLINDILDLSKIEAGNGKLTWAEVHPLSILEEMVSLFGDMAEKNGLELKLSASESLKDLRIMADELRLKQILMNLFANAVKFTPDGGRINVLAEVVRDELFIRVADTGIGVKVEDRERIFEKFQQADTSYARRHEGSGLGLALAREYVALHGGRIWVESEGEGKGSVFIVVLPIRRDMDIP